MNRRDIKGIPTNLFSHLRLLCALTDQMMQQDRLSGYEKSNPSLQGIK